MSVRASSARSSASKASKRREKREPEPIDLEPKISVGNFSLYGRPVEEVDPFVFEDTFCVIGKKYGKNYVYRFSATKSLFIFPPLSPIRNFACRVITNQLFDFFIILVIFANCVTLAMSTNYEDKKTGKIKEDLKIFLIIEVMEWIFLALYTFEMYLKVIAKGFVINKFAYLKNIWNILDFVVIVTSIISVVLSFSLRQAPEVFDLFRTLRVLRAIKAISIIPGLRMMIYALLRSAVQLLQVMSLTLFALMMFSLLALELFMGKLLQKCVLIKDGPKHLEMVYQEHSRDPKELGPVLANDPDTNKFWYEWVHDKKNWLMRKDNFPKQEYVPCGNDTWSRQCPDGYICLTDIGANFDEGWTNFDNFFSSMLSTFQLITLDFWERLYDLILSNTSPWSVLFFLIVIFLGSFYLINLMLAVVAMSYEEAYQQSVQIPLTKPQKLSLNRKASTFSFDDPSSLNVTLMTHYQKRTPSEREMIIRMMKHSTSEEVIEEEEDGDKKRPNLHTAIMTLLGHRLSVESVRRDRKKSSKTEVEESTSMTLEMSNIVVPPEAETVPAKTETAEVEIRQTPSDVKEKRNSENSSLRERPISKKTTMMQISTWASTIASTVIQAKRITQCARFAASMKAKLTPVVKNVIFESAVTFLIILNTCMMAAEHHEQPKWLDRMTMISNYFFTVAFSVEAIIKIGALQRDYFRSAWNLFDLLVLGTSIIDLCLETLRLEVMRSLRLLRIFKLAQSWITMKVLFHIIVSTFAALGYLTLLLLIVLYVFAVLGLQILGKYYTRQAFHAETEEQFPRWNFQSFWYSFMLVFRILCGEWIEPLWDCLEATKAYRSEHKCFLIFLPVLVVGNFTILNLFLALLLNSFDSEELEMQQQKEREMHGKVNKELKKVVNILVANKQSAEDTPDSSSISSDTIDGNKKSTGRGLKRFKKAARKVIKLNRRAVAEKMIEKAQAKQAITRKVAVKADSLAHLKSSTSTKDSHTAVSANTEDLQDPDPCIPQKCWYMNCRLCNSVRKLKWTKWDGHRAFAKRVVSHAVFEWFILALIFASSVTLCFEDVYLDQKPELKDALFYISVIFTAIFVIEMIFKWFALGLWKYFTNSWTILDAFIVAISLLSLSVETEIRLTGESKSRSNFAALKALRTLRALRPLRAISRWQGMKIVVNALMLAIPSIVNVLLVCLVFWLVFAIMGVQIFKGKFFRCVNNANGERIESSVIKNRTECCSNTSLYSWINQKPNFDNVIQGYLTLFQVATFEGWMEAMRGAIDSTAVNKQPERDNAIYFYIFFVLFIVFGSFFTLNLFIGVIIDNFNRLKKKYEGNLLEALLTPSQRHYYTTMKRLGSKKPRKVIRRPPNEFLALFYDLSMSRRFEISVFVMIFLNMVVMGFEHHNQRAIVTDLLAALNSFFTSIYSLEAVIKIVGLRHYYFTVPWNLFDFVLVIASIIDLSVGDLLGDLFPIPPMMLRIVRVIRIGRVLRLIKAAKGIRKLLFALVVSLPALFNIGALLSLITFIYAILGMALFGRVAKSTAIDEMYNFDTFLRSWMLLLRLMTGAGWNDVLVALTPIKPYCGPYRNIKCGRSGEADCASPALATMYLVSFLFISNLIVINMYIAIILENFYQASREEDVGIVEDDLEMFYLRWARHDPQATQFIDFEQLSEFLDSLDPPLGIPRPNIVAIVAFNLPIARGNKIHCLDILHALIKRIVGRIDDTDDFRKLQSEMEHKFRKLFPTRKLLDIISSTRTWKVQHNAAITIQRAWRDYRARKYPQDHLELSGSVRRIPSHHPKDHHGFVSKLGHLFPGHGHGLFVHESS